MQSNANTQCQVQRNEVVSGNLTPAFPNPYPWQNCIYLTNGASSGWVIFNSDSYVPQALAILEECVMRQRKERDTLEHPDRLSQTHGQKTVQRNEVVSGNLTPAFPNPDPWQNCIYLTNGASSGWVIFNSDSYVPQALATLEECVMRQRKERDTLEHPDRLSQTHGQKTVASVPMSSILGPAHGRRGLKRKREG